MPLHPYRNVQRSAPARPPPIETWGEWGWSWLGYQPTAKAAVENVRPITTTAEFRDAVEVDTGVTVIYCYAPWHESTTQLMPYMETLSTTYAFRFHKMDMDDNDLNAIASTLDVQEHPAVLVFRQAELVGKAEGNECKSVQDLMDRVAGQVEDDDW